MRQLSEISTMQYWLAKRYNLSQGWHNRFNIVLGKGQSDLTYVLTDFQKDQADSERMIAELSVVKRCATKVAGQAKMIAKSRGDAQRTRGR